MMFVDLLHTWIASERGGTEQTRKLSPVRGLGQACPQKQTSPARGCRERRDEVPVRQLAAQSRRGDYPILRHTVVQAFAEIQLPARDDSPTSLYADNTTSLRGVHPCRAWYARPVFNKSPRLQRTRIWQRISRLDRLDEGTQ